MQQLVQAALTATAASQVPRPGMKGPSKPDVPPANFSQSALPSPGRDFPSNKQPDTGEELPSLRHSAARPLTVSARLHFEVLPRVLL